MRMVATTRLLAGSTLETVPSPVLGIQTAPAPIAGVPARAPTVMLASTGLVGAGAEVPHAAKSSAARANPVRGAAVPLDSEICLLDVGAFQQRRGGSFLDDAAGFEHVASVRHRQCLGRVLLDQQDGGALLIDVADDVEDLVDQDGGEAQRGLVEQQDTGSRHQAASDREHLLLATRKRATDLIQTLFDARKQFEDMFLVPPNSLPVLAGEGAEEQVVADGQAAEDPAPLRHVPDSQPHDLVRGDVGDVFPAKPYLTLCRRSQAGNGSERCRLTRPVAADQGDDFAFVDMQRDAV